VVRRLAPDTITLLALVCAALLAVWLGYLAPRAAELPMATPSAVLAVRSFHDLEWFPDGRRYRWTDGQSRLGLPNPGGPVRLRVRLIDGPAGSTPLTLTGAGRPIDLRLLPGLRRYELLLPPTAGERIDLALSSPTVEISRRALGVGVADPRPAGGGAAPLEALPPVALAAAALFALLRAAGFGRAPSAAAVMGINAALGLFLHLGGWQYAMLSRALLPLAAGALAAVALGRWANEGPRTKNQEPRTKNRGPRTKNRGPRTNEQEAVADAVVARQWLAFGLAALVVLALALRLPWLLAGDPSGDLELAARRMFYLATEGLPGAFRRGGDYMPLRLYYLWGAAQIVQAAGASFAEPIAPLTMALIKLPQLAADVATAALIFVYARRQLSLRWAFALATMYTCAPPIWINSAWWGQVDAWLMLPMVGALLLLERGDGRWAWASLALALLVKTQAIIFAPLLYVATLRRHGRRGLVSGAATAGALLLAGAAPLIAANQGFGMAEAYLGAVGRFPRTTYGAYNLWHLALGGSSVNDFEAALGPLSYRQIGLALLAGAVLLICVGLWRRPTTRAAVAAGAAIALAFFVLPTQMHARYLFLPLASLALAACGDRRLIPLFALLAASATINVLGILNGFSPAATDLINSSPLPTVCALVNIGALLVMIGGLYREPAEAIRGEEGFSQGLRPRTPAPPQ